MRRMRTSKPLKSLIYFCGLGFCGLGASLLGIVACSSGGVVVLNDDGGDAMPDLGMGPRPEYDLSAPKPDMTAPPVDMAITMVKSCTWRERFQQVYGHAWDGADVAFVTTDGALTRGIDKLDLAAQKSQVPDIVKVKGNSNKIQEIRLLAPGGTTVLASHNGAYIYGLGYAMWLDVNGYGEAGITEVTLIRQFGMEEASYQQLVGLFRVLTKNAESQVPAADLADFQLAAAALMGKIESGTLTFAIGTGHAADFPGTAQTVNGKKFSFQLSDGFGMDPQLGFQRDGVWGPLWQTYSPSGGWSASAPGLQPKCGGCTVDHYGGATYQYCDGPTKQADAQALCQSHGGNLATVGDVVTGAFLRGLAPGAGTALIGLSDLKMTGQYVWETGAAATYTNWSPGQPDHWMNQEHCVQLTDAKSSTAWNDISCDSPLPYLCQLP